MVSDTNRYFSVLNDIEVLILKGLNTVQRSPFEQASINAIAVTHDGQIVYQS